MENKYFTPDIEDICIGYECEIWMPQNPDFDKWDWESFTLEKNHFDHEQPFFPLIAKLRVLYLTKEQIEAEGWKFDYNLGDFDYYIKTVNDTEYELEFFYKERININIWKRTLYNGECKDINTFRKLIKLLGI
jgi:hypothetical protein